MPIAEIAQGNPEEVDDAKVKVLSEMIQHHVKEEEKPGEGFFAQARKGDVDMKALGGTLQARKAQLGVNQAGRVSPAGNPQLHGPQVEAGPRRGGRRQAHGRLRRT